MPKIGDGYFQFSSRGLKDLLESIKLVGGNAKQLESIGRSRGLFENSLSKDLAAVRLLTAEIKNATKQAKSSRDAVRQLRAESARSSLNTDRLVEQRRATANSRANIARNDARNVASSPAAMAAERTALRQRLMFADTERKRIEARALKDKSTTPSFKRRVSAAASSFAMTQAEAEDPAKLRAKAQEIRETAKALSGFKKGNVSQVVAEMNALADATEKAAAATDRLTKLENISSVMSPERKGQVRGSIRDELNATARAAATSGRQAIREMDSERSDDRLGRRVEEIRSRDDLTDRQEDIEIGIASKEVADSLKRLAQEVREAPIDESLREAAIRFRDGASYPGDLKAAVKTAEARRAGASKAGSLIDDAEFRARTGGDSEDAVAYAEQLASLEAAKKKLIEGNEELEDSELGVNQSVIKSIESDINLAKSKLELTQELDKLIDSNKELLATKARLDTIEAKGLQLSKEEKQERKRNNKELAIAAKQEKLLRDARDGSNRSMHDAAGASRRWNFQLQQASYGVQDFVQVIGQTGLSGALRASANNMASFFGSSGTPQGAIIGAVGTIAMIGLADAIVSVGGEAETAEEKLEKLLRTTERFSKVKISGREFSSGVAEQALGKGDFATGAGAKAREEATKSIDEIANLIKTIDAVAQDIAKQSGKERKDKTSISGANIAAMKLAGANPDELKKMINEAVAKLQSSKPPEAGPAAFGVDSKLVADYRKSLEDVAKLNLDDAEHLAKLAAILDPANKKIEESLQEYKNKVSDLSVTAGHSSTSLDRMNESLDAFERDVLERSRFSDSALPKASDEIAARLSESASRLRGLTSDFEAVGSFDTPDKELTPEAKFRKELVGQEQAVFDRYLKSLESINSQIDSATSPSSGIAKTLGDLISEFASARADLALAISSKPLAEQQAILKSSDAAKSRDLVSAVKDAVEGFSGEVAKTLGESQSQADQRMRRDLSDLINSIVASETKTDDLLVPAIRAAIDKIGKNGGQSGTSVTAISDLHRKIQESLRDDTSDLDIQKEHSDLLTQIRDLLGGQKKPQGPQSGVAPGSSGQMSVPPPQFNYSGSASEGAQKLANDPTLKGARQLLNDAIVKSIDLMSARAEREQSSLNGLRTSTQRGISERNIESLSGSRGPASASVEESMANARRNVQMQGLPVNRFGGAVADFAPGLRNPALTESQRRAISSPVASSPANETPEEQRKRRIAERRAEFGDILAAGPEINRGNIRQNMPAINPKTFAAAGDSAAYATRGNFEAIAREAAKAGIPVSVPDQGKSQRGLKSQMRRDSIFRGDKIREREEAEAAEKAKRYGERQEREAEAAEKAIANEALRESGLGGSALRSRAIRDKEKRGMSWMQKLEAGLLAPDGSDLKKEDMPKPVAPLSSNVQTDTTQQTQTAQTEAIQYQKRAADTLVEMLKLMKTRGPSEGLLIG